MISACPEIGLCGLADADLVAFAKHGKTSYFACLYNRHRDSVRRYVARMLDRDPYADPQDIEQETFLKAWQHLAQFQERASFRTWLTSIAINEGLMKLRKRCSDKSVPLDDYVDDGGKVMPREFADWKPNPEQVAAQSELRKALLDAMESLPPALRVVFLLRAVEGFSTQETAEQLHLTVSAVKARHFRDRLRLREALSKEFTKQSCSAA